MRRVFFIILLALAIPASAFAATASEIHINQDGKLTAKNVVVMQKSESGSTFFSRVAWGDIFLRLTVLSAPNGTAAKITKNNGGPAAYTDVKVGDILEVEGTLTPGAETLLVNATSVRDLSLNVETKNISGTIKTLNVSLNTLTLTDKKLGAITVVAPYNIQKGARTITVGELAVGDKILSASGNFDYSTKTFTASDMEVYQDKSVFKTQNFQGTLKSLSGTALPVSAVITVGKNPSTGLGAGDYTVYLPASTKVMSKNKAVTTLQRYTVGDTVRFYGSIRPANLQEIDASSLRNFSF